MILNQASDGVLSVLLVLRRALLAYGPLPRQRLLDLCAPASLRSGSSPADTTEAGEDEPDEEPADTAAAGVQKPARTTLTRWRQVGLFAEATDEVRTISLKPGFERPGLNSADLRPVRESIRRLVLDPKNNLDIVAVNTKSEVAGVCADFTRAVCWALAQDVFAFPGGGDFGRVQALENEQFGSQKGTSQSKQSFFAFKNSTRWTGFRAWAPFLGFGWWSPMAKEVHLAIDPTEAVADELPDVFAHNAELPVATFVARLAERLPVLDGGTYRVALETILRGSPTWRAPAAHEISTALSRALVRLAEAGMLRLYDRADAPDRRTLLGRGAAALQQVTDIEWARKR